VRSKLDCNQRATFESMRVRIHLAQLMPSLAVLRCRARLGASFASHSRTNQIAGGDIAFGRLRPNGWAMSPTHLALPRSEDARTRARPVAEAFILVDDSVNGPFNDRKLCPFLNGRPFA